MKPKRKISRKLLRWRDRQPEGTIMSSPTFKRVEREAAARGVRDPKAIAGAAYWRTAKARFRERHAKKRGSSRGGGR